MKGHKSYDSVYMKSPEQSRPQVRKQIIGWQELGVGRDGRESLVDTECLIEVIENTWNYIDDCTTLNIQKPGKLDTIKVKIDWVKLIIVYQDIIYL